MKKNIIKFITLVPFASLATSAIALATSCKPSHVKPIEMHNLLNEYVPQSTQLPGNTYWSQTQATNEYINAVQNNPQILVDDACLSAQQFVAVPLLPVLSKFEFGISKPKFSKTKIWEYGGNDFEYHTISITQKFSVTYELHSNNNTTDVWTLNLEVKYDNVVFYAYENNNGKWSLGLFDYNIGEEAFWPFVSNIEPWTITYSCNSLHSEYKGDHGSEGNLIYNHCSYYSGNINSGQKMVNFIEYYLNYDPATIEEIMEHSIMSIILIDYESWYLNNVDNIPEVRASTMLNCQYNLDNESTDIQLGGLVFIRPSIVTEEMMTENKFHIEFKNKTNPIQYSSSDKDAPFYSKNTIHLDVAKPISYSQPSDDAPYRYPLFIKGSMDYKWSDIIPYVTPVTPFSVYFEGASAEIEIAMYGDDDLGLPWTSHNPLIQKVPLNYYYVVQKVIGG